MVSCLYSSICGGYYLFQGSECLLDEGVQSFLGVVAKEKLLGSRVILNSIVYKISSIASELIM